MKAIILVVMIGQLVLIGCSENNLEVDLDSNTVCSSQDVNEGTCNDETSITLTSEIDNSDGADGNDDSGCTSLNNEDGTTNISCDDGSVVVLSDGMNPNM